MSELSERPNVVVISGNTHRPSKSKTLAEALTHAVAAAVPIEVTAYDIVDAGAGLAAFTRANLSLEALRVVEAIENADALIISVPVYKGSYPGLFKHLIDFVELTTLIDKPVLLAATGGGLRHALVIEHQLRPLFGFFAALTVPTAVYASDNEFLNGGIVDPVLRERVRIAASQFGNLLRTAEKPIVTKVA